VSSGRSSQPAVRERGAWFARFFGLAFIGMGAMVFVSGESRHGAVLVVPATLFLFAGTLLVTFRSKVVADPVRREVSAGWGFGVVLARRRYGFDVVREVVLAYEVRRGTRSSHHGYSATLHVAEARGHATLALVSLVPLDRARAIAERFTRAVGCDLRDRATGLGRVPADELDRPLRDRLASRPTPQIDAAIVGAVAVGADAQGVRVSVRRAGWGAMDGGVTIFASLFGVGTIVGAILLERLNPAALPALERQVLMAVLIGGALGLMAMVVGPALTKALTRWELVASARGIDVTRVRLGRRTWHFAADALEAVARGHDLSVRPGGPSECVLIVSDGQVVAVGAGLGQAEHRHLQAGLERGLSGRIDAAPATSAAPGL
jgi:hypothetical protein